MESLRTNQLKAGMFAALVMDTPNAGGIHIVRQGTIEKIQAADMYGSPSEILSLIHIRPKGGDMWSTQVITVNNSHMWLVREDS